MIVGLGLVLSICVPAVRSPDLEGAIASARSGRFVEALLAAEAEADPARRAGATLYVRHHAGDLEGALRVAENARSSGIATAWLEERQAFVALTLRDAASARAALSALAARADGGGAEIASAAAGYRAELETLERTLAERDRGIGRAQIVALATLVLATATFLWSAFTRDRARPSP